VSPDFSAKKLLPENISVIFTQRVFSFLSAAKNKIVLAFVLHDCITIESRLNSQRGVNEEEKRTLAVGKHMGRNFRLGFRSERGLPWRV
jgi:hypothetical protein